MVCVNSMYVCMDVYCSAYLYFRASLTKLLGELTIKVKKTPADLMAARVWNEQVNQVKMSCRLYCQPYCVCMSVCMSECVNVCVSVIECITIRVLIVCCM